MRRTTVWKKLLGVEHIVIEGVSVVPGTGKGGEVAVVRVRPDAARRLRCPHCGKRCPYRDDGEGCRLWRDLDAFGMRAYLEAAAPRVTCPRHGVIVAAVPWARHGSRFTTRFEDYAAWLAAQMAWRKAAKLLRTTWESVQAIVTRVAAGARACRDRLAGLHRIGIDEKNWGTGEKYLTVVTDHDTGLIVWMAPGRSKETLSAFFTALGADRARLLTHVSCDGASWIHAVVREHAPQALICLDAFHVVQWAGEALDTLRRRLAAQLRATGNADQAAAIGSAMWALRKDGRKLTSGQRVSLARVAADNEPLYRGYLMRDQLREAFKAKGEHGKALLAGLIAWMQRCRIPEFTKLARTLGKHRQMIFATLDHGPSNGRAEALNAQIQALIARARGFRTAAAVIAMAELVHGGLCPDLPFR